MGYEGINVALWARIEDYHHGNIVTTRFLTNDQVLLVSELGSVVRTFMKTSPSFSDGSGGAESRGMLTDFLAYMLHLSWRYVKGFERLFPSEVIELMAEYGTG